MRCLHENSIDRLGGRGDIDVLAVGLAPIQHGLVALLELVFISQHDLRPVRQGQAEICPETPVVHIQVAVQIKLWRGHRGIVAAAVARRSPGRLPRATQATVLWKMLQVGIAVAAPTSI